MTVGTSDWRRLLACLWGLLTLVGSCADAAIARPLAPSDCVAGHVDSTCAGAVARGTTDDSGGSTVPHDQTGPLYQGLLARGPYLTAEYWGFDFVADAHGAREDDVLNAYRNSTADPVTLTFAVDVPNQQTCGGSCRPTMIFKVGPGFRSGYPKLKVSDGVGTVTIVVPAGQPYAWIIGPWSRSNVTLTVTVPQGSRATLTDVGLDAHPDVATAIPPRIRTCLCADATSASCSIGTRFSNGLMSPWYAKNDSHFAPDAFNNCPPLR